MNRRRRGEGNDAEGHQARVPDGTEEMRRNYGNVADDGPVPMDLGRARCENDAE